MRQSDAKALHLINNFSQASFFGAYFPDTHFTGRPMTKRFHFISGLPRSGSTLLSALLLQNPRFHSGMTSPVGTLFSGMLQQFSAGSEFGAVINREQRQRLSRGLFENFYADQGGKEVIFDTNRMWCAKLPALLDLFPDAKVIACDGCTVPIRMRTPSCLSMTTNATPSPVGSRRWHSATVWWALRGRH
jgi:hypothetical protein